MLWLQRWVSRIHPNAPPEGARRGPFFFGEGRGGYLTPSLQQGTPSNQPTLLASPLRFSSHQSTSNPNQSNPILSYPFLSYPALPAECLPVPTFTSTSTSAFCYLSNSIPLPLLLSCLSHLDPLHSTHILSLLHILASSKLCDDPLTISHSSCSFWKTPHASAFVAFPTASQRCSSRPSWRDAWCCTSSWS